MEPRSYLKKNKKKKLKKKKKPQFRSMSHRGCCALSCLKSDHGGGQGMEMFRSLAPLPREAQGLPGHAGAELRDARVMQPSRMELISPLPVCSG